MIRRRTAILGAAIVLVAVLAIGVGVLRPFGRATPTEALPAPRYVEETETAGIDHTYGGADFFVGGGVAVFDCSGDGRPDVFLAGGEGASGLYRNESAVGGALRFSAVPSAVTDLGRVAGAYAVDIDGDGHLDLVVLRAGEDVLLRGVGDCRFERANESWSFEGGEGWTTAFSASWEHPGGLPTLAFGDYVRLDASGDATGGCGTNVLVRPDAAGEGYGPGRPLDPAFCALSMLFSDWDRSGRRDLRVSNDRHYYDQATGQEQLWRIEPGLEPRLYTDADGWVAVQVEGMGIASHDLDGDGYPEVFLTSQAANRLQTLTAGPAKPTYRDIGARRGVNASRPFTGGDPLPSTAWHDEFQDVNNDGFVDLFIAKGNVGAMTEFATRDPSNLLLGQPDGTFVEGAEAAGIVRYERGRGASVADLNLDGLPDLVQVHYGDPVMLWRNVGSGTADQPTPMGGWTGIRISQAGANRDAIGAWIEVRVGETTLRREVTVGGGHAGGQLGWTHFGLGPARGGEVRVQWPDGTIGPWQSVEANRFAVIERDADAARVWQPPRP